MAFFRQQANKHDEAYLYINIILNTRDVDKGEYAQQAVGTDKMTASGRM